ncbi:MAG TPA: GntG family PLP-dependent aldolase [Gemmatimonadaceae bacterium]|nr:GntG family PLP-dependent aldolase [Gemmatimonadaceae bacterium]
MSIDLRSDTVTRPTAAMRQAIATAEIGDDVLDGDPTVKRLEERIAAMLGKEAALFFPSGTMANQTGVWLMSRPGTEVLLGTGSHVMMYEAAGAAALCGVQVRPVQGKGPVMDAESLRAAIRPASPYTLSASLVCIENTHNGAGGVITPLAEMRAISEVAREFSLGVHLDGARLWNAQVASGTPVADFASCADTVMVSFSKGLGCPVGAALAGPAALMREGWLVRKRFGGGMRQSGFLAAAVLYALDAHMDRLKDDHERARRFAKAVDGVNGMCVVPPDTNIVMIDLGPGCDANAVEERAAAQGVLVSAWTRTRLRACFHLDVDDAGTDEAARVICAS